MHVRRLGGLAIALVVAMVLLGAGAGAAKAGPAKTIQVTVPGDYPTIQAAVDAVDTTLTRGPTQTVVIKVAKGVYHEAVNVTKSRITIEGTQPHFKFDPAAGRDVLVDGTIIDGAGTPPVDDRVGVDLYYGETVTDVTFTHLGVRNARSNDAYFGVDAATGTAQRIHFDHVMVELRDDNDLAFARYPNGDLVMAPTAAPAGYCSGYTYPFYVLCSEQAFFEADGIFFYASSAYGGGGYISDSSITHSVVMGDDPRGNNAIDGTNPTKYGFSTGFFDIGGTGMTFSHNQASGVWRGLELADDSNVVVDHNTLTDSRIGMIFVGTAQATISHNDAIGNGNDSLPLDPSSCPFGYPDWCFAGGGIWFRGASANDTLNQNKLTGDQGSGLLWGTSGSANVLSHNEFGATCDLRIAASCVTSDAAASAATPGNSWDKNKYR